VTAALARRVTSRAPAAAVAVTLAAAVMMLGAGTAAAQPRQVACTIGGDPLAAPVTLSEGEQVQLAVLVPLLDARIDVGAPQAPASSTDVLSSAIDEALADILGVDEGTLCRAAVDVQSVAGSVASLPPVTLPTLPRLLPQSVQLSASGIDVSIEQGAGTGAPPGAGDPAPNPPDGIIPPPTSPGGPNGSIPGYRFDRGRIPLYDLSSAPYGVNTRFGAAAAPAFRFGQRVPGYAPQFGILSSQDARSDVAGKVQALPPGGGPTAVGLPVLLAVLMLSSVSGVLARTWTLRRAA
jgi:hypothetical protein